MLITVGFKGLYLHPNRSFTNPYCILFLQAEERASQAEGKVIDLEKEIDGLEGKTVLPDC